MLRRKYKWCSKLRAICRAKVCRGIAISCRFVFIFAEMKELCSDLFHRCVLKWIFRKRSIVVGIQRRRRRFETAAGRSRRLRRFFMRIFCFKAKKVCYNSSTQVVEDLTFASLVGISMHCHLTDNQTASPHYRHLRAYCEGW